MARKNFLFFHGFFASAIFLNVITGFLMMRNIFFIEFISLSFIHKLAGGLLLLTILLLFATKQGRSGLKVISTMTKPKLVDLKKKNILLFSFKLLNLIFASAVLLQLITGMILIFNLFWLQVIYRIHFLLALPLIVIIFSHIVLAVLFNAKKNAQTKLSIVKER